jgi:hypothetical protein
VATVDPMVESVVLVDYGGPQLPSTVVDVGKAARISSEERRADPIANFQTKKENPTPPSKYICSSCVKPQTLWPPSFITVLLPPFCDHEAFRSHVRQKNVPSTSFRRGPVSSYFSLLILEHFRDHFSQSVVVLK